MQRVGIETGYRRAVQINHRQIRVARGRYAEMQHIRPARTALRTNRNLVVTVQARQTTNRRALQLLVLQLIGHHRQHRRALRQVHPVFVRLRSKALYHYAVQIYAFQRVHAVGLYRERNLINRCASVARRHRDTGLAVHAAGRHVNRLVFVARHCNNLRQHRRADRQSIGVR